MPDAPAPTRAEEAREAGQVYGIIDPDYARVFTVARCIAWSEGYAMVMHGSFTRDLDLLAVPWAEEATDAEHLIRRIACALDDLDLLIKDPKAPSQATRKPHGRLAWTLTFKTFGDPRFIDISVMPRAEAEVARLTAAVAISEVAVRSLRARVAVLEAALTLCADELDWQIEQTKHCGDPNYECPLQDIHKASDSHAEARAAARSALHAGENTGGGADAP